MEFNVRGSWVGERRGEKIEKRREEKTKKEGVKEKQEKTRKGGRWGKNLSYMKKFQIEIYN